MDTELHVELVETVNAAIAAAETCLKKLRAFKEKGCPFDELDVVAGWGRGRRSLSLVCSDNYC
jgi:hypothetical protein